MSRNGKYSRHRRNRKWPLYLLAAAVLLAAVLTLTAVKKGNRSPDVFGRICAEGYTGTAEQWIASLVGEDVGNEQTPTAYELACRQGYGGTVEQWISTITGLEGVEEDVPLFSLVRDRGYTGSMAEWLGGLVAEPEGLGASRKGAPATEYELACQFGYDGTFIEWVVSMAQDKVF